MTETTDVNALLVEYKESLQSQLAEVEALLEKPTKASAKRVRKNSLVVAEQGKVLRKVTVKAIG